MTTNIYQKLAEHLDTLPQRYPTNTGTGLELKMLRHIFSPEEAEMAIQLKPAPEPPGMIAERRGLSLEATEKLLAEMFKKGQILRVGKNGEHQFMAAPFVVGIIEYQLERFTKEMIADLEAFGPILMDQTFLKGKTRELRTIPIKETVTDTTEVMPYESAEAIIKSAQYISVAECMCRKISQVKDEPCDRPLETCFQFNSATHIHVDMGLSRRIHREEALTILNKAVASSLVVQAGAAQNPGGICLCCGCCCLPLSACKHKDKPALYTNSNYVAVVDEEACSACGICETRCQMDAIAVEDCARIDLERCIGCGLCATTCDFGAMKLHKKDENHQWIPQPDHMTALKDIYKERRQG